MSRLLTRFVKWFTVGRCAMCGKRTRSYSVEHEWYACSKEHDEQAIEGLVEHVLAPNGRDEYGDPIW